MYVSFFSSFDERYSRFLQGKTSHENDKEGKGKQTKKGKRDGGGGRRRMKTENRRHPSLAADFMCDDCCCFKGPFPWRGPRWGSGTRGRWSEARACGPPWPRGTRERTLPRSNWCWRKCCSSWGSWSTCGTQRHTYLEGDKGAFMRDERRDPETDSMERKRSKIMCTCRRHRSPPERSPKKSSWKTRPGIIETICKKKKKVKKLNVGIHRFIQYLITGPKQKWQMALSLVTDSASGIRPSTAPKGFLMKSPSSAAQMTVFP